MKKIRVLLLGIVFALIAIVPASAQDSTPNILLLTANGPVAPTMSEYLKRGIRTGEQRGAEAIIFQLNTPGGSVDTMNEIVQEMRASDVPIIVYVAPRGAFAASAGTVLTVAGHVSAMAPETTIGAASPVGGGGEDLGETIESKLKEALKATIRSLMEGRPPDAIALAEDTIENATAVTSSEALKIGLIDFIATDIGDLLQQVDGVTVSLPGGNHTFQTRNAIVTDLSPSLIEQIFAVLTNPNIVFLLLTLGVQSILLELGSPGGWVAGFIGVVALTLAGFGLGVLEVNWVGLIFLATSFVLFILDIKAPTHGALTVAGVASFIAGALVLFNSPGTPQFQRVSVPLVVVSGVSIGGVFLVFLTFALRAQRAPIATGYETMIGRVGVVKEPLTPKGVVHVAGEFWSADLVGGQDSLPKGARVRVLGVDGVRLKVEGLES